ncbi:MAG: hypothetical protein Kow00124_14500 [Anaerolineae bacterium]
MSETPSAAALLFTDAAGRVVFVDSNFLRMFGYIDFGEIVGEPLSQVLGLGHRETQDLLHELSRTGSIRERRLSLADRRGQVQVITCTGVATYDERGEFIGADLTFTSAAEAALHEQAARHHFDTLNRHIRQTYDELGNSAVPDIDREGQLLTLYLKSHLDALTVLLSRLAGYRVCDTLGRVFTDTVREHDWPLMLSGSMISLLPGAPPPREAYRQLLATLIGYASGVVGRRRVVTELAAVHHHTDPQVQTLADACGLSDLLTL